MYEEIFCVNSDKSELGSFGSWQ